MITYSYSQTPFYLTKSPKIGMNSLTYFYFFKFSILSIHEVRRRNIPK